MNDFDYIMFTHRIMEFIRPSLEYRRNELQKTHFSCASIQCEVRETDWLYGVVIFRVISVTRGPDLYDVHPTHSEYLEKEKISLHHWLSDYGYAASNVSDCFLR